MNTKPCVKYRLVVLLILLCAGQGFCSKAKYTPVRDVSMLKNYVGKKVTVAGAVSKIMWQHIIAPPETHPVENYFDVGKIQIVIYTKEKISCDGKLKVNGTVLELRGAGKGSKVDETYAEYHIVVDSWKCLK